MLSLDQFVFHDKITATMGDHKIDIPIVATRPAASIQFNKLANFGFIAEGMCHSLAHSLTHSLTHPLTYSLT